MRRHPIPRAPLGVETPESADPGDTMCLSRCLLVAVAGRNSGRQVNVQLDALADVVQSNSSASDWMSQIALQAHLTARGQKVSREHQYTEDVIAAVIQPARESLSRLFAPLLRQEPLEWLDSDFRDWAQSDTLVIWEHLFPGA